MTDNKIIKALELCGNEEDGNCAIRGCPFHNRCKTDVHILEKEALALINRQQVNIKKLEKIEYYSGKAVEALKKENQTHVFA